jgi:hypothetical protein
MKNWKQAKKEYIKDHLSQNMAQPERRINALAAIENILNEQFPALLKDDEVFTNIKRMYFIKLYECLKGPALSDAEKSVINGLYKFSR